MSTSHPTQAIVLFGHGSRDPLWHKPMEAVMQRIRHDKPEWAVACAYLEISTPDLATACQQLIAHGVQRIAVVPMFLGVGRHAREDLPQLLAALRDQYPQIAWELRPAVSEDPRLLQALCDIAVNP